MPKMKTNRGAAKRFKRAANGGFRCRQSYRNHILTKKAPKRKRQLRSPATGRSGRRPGRQPPVALRLTGEPAMPRARNPVQSRARRKKILKQAKGYYGARSRSYPRRQAGGHQGRPVRVPGPPAAQAPVPGALDRPDQTPRPVSTACPTAVSMNGLDKAGIAVDRKILAELAVEDKAAFGVIARQAGGRPLANHRRAATAPNASPTPRPVRPGRTARPGAWTC